MMKMPRPIRRPVHWLLGALLVSSLSAHADAYRFEMVVFERPDGAVEQTVTDDAQPPGETKAVGRLDSLAVGGRRLAGVAGILEKRGMIVLEHIAWAQNPRGRNSEDWYRVGGGRLTGLVRVTRGRFLHVDADLLLRDVGADRSIRASLYRRMRSGELHYLDHPRLGIVIRADRLRRRSTPDQADASAGEPKPAEPAGGQPPG